ncbi:MAG TPA: hypothetical protein VF880_07130 [Actinomycetes bacterium]
MRPAMLLVAVGQATVTAAAAWELLGDRRRPPGQRRRPRTSWRSSA